MPFTYADDSQAQQSPPSAADDTQSDDPLRAQLAQHAADARSMARGAIKGITGIITLPADAGMWAGHKIANAAGLGDGSDNYTDAGDLVNRGLDAVGLKSQGGVRGAVMETLGGLTAGARAPESPVPAANNAPSQYWRSAGAQGGRNQEIAASAIGDAIGEPGVTKITPEVLDAADKRISAVFDNARSDNRITLFDGKGAIKNILQLSDDMTPADGALIKSNPVTKALRLLSRGYANNEELGNLSSQLGKAAKSAVNKDYDLGTGIYKVKDYVDEIISNNLSGAEKADYDAARAQYRNLWSVVLARSGHLNPAGESDIEAIGRHLFRLDPEGYMLGQNKTPLYELARQAAGGGSALNLMQQTAAGAAGGALKKLAQLGPQATQYLWQRGGPRFMQWASRQPGLVSAGSDAANSDEDE